MKSSQTIALWGGVLVAALVSVTLLLSNKEQQPNTDQTIAEEPQTLVVTSDNDDMGADPDALLARQLPYDSQHGALAKSLKGIYFDRDLATDEHGNLRLSSDLKDIFDFFFSAIEEEELETVLARINEYLSYKLDEPALSQARASLENYVNYKTALLDFESEQSDAIAKFIGTGEEGINGFSEGYLDFIAERQEQVKVLRSQYLGDDLHQAFYASREQYDDFMVRSLSINANTALSEAEKRAQLYALENQMPEEFIESRKAANPVDALRSVVAEASPTNNEEVYQARAKVVGVEAATRLSSLDAERAAWTNRYEAYVISRDAIINNQGLSEHDQADAIKRLRQESFSEQERLRVSVLDMYETSDGSVKN